ncbi:DNA (cytosine-5-)-methyltransferase [Streptomyces sp. 4N509B]|uniref:DNA (cytosine-5-)-methyltransferase n=1 Tax=Streptomyces sp. 4N509B TaxID=3457413 RepID=UPI003FD1F062
MLDDVRAAGGCAVRKGQYGVPLERSDYLKLEPNEHSCAPEGFAQWLDGFGQGKRLAVDLFSGAGGLSLGLQRAGWTIAAAVDMNERALETHAANFSGMSLHMDLGDPEEREKLERHLEPARGMIDLVAGGPPCQPYSRAGRSKIRSLVDQHGRDPHDRRKELWLAYLDMVERLSPRAVLMENVPDMGLSDDFSVVRAMEHRLENLGYATQVRLVDAWKYGVPQHRKRLILLARRDVERFDWGQEREPVRLRDAIGDLPVLPVVARERVGQRELPYAPPEEPSTFVGIMREGVPEDVVWDHMTRRVRTDDLKIFSGMDSRTLYSQVPRELQRYRADHFTDKYKRLSWNDFSRSITAHIAKDGYWYIHPDQHRTLTVREAARVQTFPDRFRFAGTRSDAFTQIGNAVPPLLGQAAARVLRPLPGVVASPGGLAPYWVTVRGRLTEWARRQRDAHWFELPTLSAPAAAVVAVLSGAKLRRAELERLVGMVHKRKVLSVKVLKDLLESAPTTAARTRLERLGTVVGRSALWQSGDDVPEAVPLKPSEATLYDLLIGRDALWVGQGAVRVAARVNGSTSDQKNRLSDGRVDLVRLVGSGADAPLRMAALRLIGNTMCLPSRPVCQQCPLSEYCPKKGPAPPPQAKQTFSSEATLFTMATDAPDLVQESAPAVSSAS